MAIKNVQNPEGRRYGNEEITDDDSLGMIVDEGLPALTRHTTRPGHVLVFRNRSRRQLYPKLQQQLIGNSILAPCRILSIHLAHQRPDVFRQRRSTRRTRLPSPEN